ncbi:hypothetical protein Tco_0872321 [Tanacetum coccineum]
MESNKKSIDERALHKRQYDTRVNERQRQTTKGKDDTCKALDDNIRPIYDEEPVAEVQLITDHNVFATGQHHTEQPEFNNKGEVDQNAKQCHDKCPLPAKLTDNQITQHSYQSLESKNICLKKTVAQFQKDFSKLEANCVTLELKYQNQALKEGQHGQFSKVKSNEARVKHDIDVIETINIELEHKMAKLLKENETLKRHYKELSDSIKTTRAKNIKHTTSLIAQNAEFKAQLQEKGFAITALKMIVRQPTAFKSERPRISKPWFASQVDVNNNFPKPVTTNYLPREKEPAFAKPHHMIAPSSSRYSSNDMVHNHYLEEVKKKTQESGKIFKIVVLRWVPTRKIFTSSTTKVDSEPTNGSNEDITNQYECEQTLDVSAGTLSLVQGWSHLSIFKKEGLEFGCLKRTLVSQKPGLPRFLKYDKQAMTSDITDSNSDS